MARVLVIIMEIERKWLVSGWPEGMKSSIEMHMDQGYVTTSPTVRYRREGDRCVLCFKTPGTLSREELELPLTEEDFQKIQDFVKLPTIPKTHRRYPLPGGLTLEVNLVDEGMPTQFWYAEIEFETEAEACAFSPAEHGLGNYLAKDVTEDRSYTMAAYWNRTRKGTSTD